MKPANINLRRDGTVKVLDFGLAKLVDGPARDVYRVQPDLTASPTITSPAMMTGVGMILGTAAYMAPEQARGQAVDRRADIWAFGCFGARARPAVASGGGGCLGVPFSYATSGGSVTRRPPCHVFAPPHVVRQDPRYRSSMV